MRLTAISYEDWYGFVTHDALVQGFPMFRGKGRARAEARARAIARVGVLCCFVVPAVGGADVRKGLFWHMLEWGYVPHLNR